MSYGSLPPISIIPDTDRSSTVLNWLRSLRPRKSKRLESVPAPVIDMAKQRTVAAQRRNEWSGDPAAIVPIDEFSAAFNRTIETVTEDHDR